MKVFLLFFIFFTSLSFGQAKTKKKKGVAPQWTVEQILQSNDPVKMATFIKNNPNHEQVTIIKSKILQLLSPEKKQVENNTNTVKGNQKSAQARNTTLTQDDKTSEILNHLFSNNENLKEAYVQVSNLSECPMDVKISNRQNTYTLTISPKSNAHVMVEKGEYYLSTVICSTKFSSNHTINKDMMIRLGKK